MAILTVPVGASRILWTTPAAAGVTEAKTGWGLGVRGLWKFLRIAAALLVHSWFIPEAQGSKRAGQGRGEGGMQGHGHMLDLPDWPYYTLHILPSACSIYSCCVWACMFWIFTLVTSEKSGSKREGELESLCHFLASLCSLSVPFL